MTDTDNASFQPIRDAWHLYQAMSEGLAGQQAQTEFTGGTSTDAWGELSSRVETTKNDLYGLAGPSDTVRERHHNRHERNEIAGVNEALDETYSSLVRLAESELRYLRLEQGTREAIAEGSHGDLESLDMARSEASRARETLRQSRANLALRLENLADDTGSGLFTPDQT